MNQPHQVQQILTLPQVAEIIGKNPDTLRSCISSSNPKIRARVPTGAFHAPHSRRWLWFASDVYAWLAAGRDAHTDYASSYVVTAATGAGKGRGRPRKIQERTEGGAA